VFHAVGHKTQPRRVCVYSYTISGKKQKEKKEKAKCNTMQIASPNNKGSAPWFTLSRNNVPKQHLPTHRHFEWTGGAAGNPP